MTNSIIEAVFNHAQQHPAQSALFFEEQTISYGQLFTESAQFAQALASSGFQPGERLALFLGNCPAFVVAYLGTQLAGGIVVLVNTQYRQVELSHILNDAGVQLCVTSTEGRELILPLTVPTLKTLIIAGETEQPFPTHTLESLTLADFIVQNNEDEQSHPFAMPQADTPAILGYTSGTTGRAKGALLYHRNLTANIRAVTTAWHWTHEDRLLLVLPLFHAHGLMVGLHGTLFSGGSAILRPKFEASDVLATLSNDPGISLFFGVPTMYIRLLAEAKRHGVPAHPLRLFVSGSAPLSPQVFSDFARIFGQTILERYGMTETIMNLTNPYEGERRAGTVGSPFPGQEARVVDVQNRQPVLAETIGEIEVRGPHVFTGYWNRPDATVEAFTSDGWFKTGDLGWCSADGYYTITGRARELIISGGYNIYPREIEDVLEQHPAVAEAAVIGLPDAEMGEQVVAVIVLKPDQHTSASELIAFCRAHLASYKKPRSIVFVDALPRNALGKVQKHVLLEQRNSSVRQNLAQMLQETLVHEIPITQHLDIRVAHYDQTGLTLKAPLAPNINHKRTAFAGSLNSLVTLAGWGLLWLILQELEIPARVVIQDSSCSYLRPVSDDFLASCARPAQEEIDKLAEAMNKRGKARIELSSQIRNGTSVAVSFTGRYVIMLIDERAERT